jgi:hypothetical protein
MIGFPEIIKDEKNKSKYKENVLYKNCGRIFIE